MESKRGRKQRKAGGRETNERKPRRVPPVGKEV